MSSSVNINAWLSTLGAKNYSMPIVILYVTEGCNLKCAMCSYRDALPGELSINEIEQLAKQLSDYGLRHIVFSGGEPLLRKDFPAICQIFQKLNVKQTLLTNGLLLKKRLAEIATYFDEIIVSLDGANEETHDPIRGVRSFVSICDGIRDAVAMKLNVSIRTVIQKNNFQQIDAMVNNAHSLGVKRISFLAADVVSDSFGRDTRGEVRPPSEITLNQSEAAEFRKIVSALIAQHEADFQSKFISESPSRLMHLVEYFEALNGKVAFPGVVCNAPNVSVVITSTGMIQPCFFLPSFGNVRQTAINGLTNNKYILATRKDVAGLVLERCKTCVCSLHVSSLRALTNSF